MEMTSVEKASRFILGGNAVFTAVSNATEKRYTYKVQKAKNADVYFVSTMFTSDNGVYVYIGYIKNGVFTPSGKKISITDKRIVSFDWIYKKLFIQKFIPNELTLYHEGKCGRCARRLTVPESIETGFGPECSTYICD